MDYTTFVGAGHGACYFEHAPCPARTRSGYRSHSEGVGAGFHARPNAGARAVEAFRSIRGICIFSRYGIGRLMSRLYNPADAYLSNMGQKGTSPLSHF